MRVIAGEAKGRHLYPVPGETTRPITDRVKESLFNILRDRIDDATFLDLFAGTGGVGIEALSRGARSATFVEKEPRAIATIRRNLETTGLSGRARVVRDDVFRFIESSDAQAFDIIYVAPPQYRELWAQTVAALDTSPLVGPHTLVVVQIYPKEYHPIPLTRLELVDERKYGSTLLCFYRPREGPPQSP